MTRVRYSYWTGSETEEIDFETNAKPKTIRKLMKLYDKEYGEGTYELSLEEYIRDKGYKFAPYLEKVDVYHNV